MRPNAKCVDRVPLLGEGVEGVLSDVVGRDNLELRRHARDVEPILDLLEHVASLEGEVREIARVEPDPERLEPYFIHGEGAEEEVGDPRDERVVRIDECQEGRRERLRVANEGGQLAVVGVPPVELFPVLLDDYEDVDRSPPRRRLDERRLEVVERGEGLDERVGVRPANLHSELEPSEGRGRPVKSPDVRILGRRQPAIRTLGTAEAELEERLVGPDGRAHTRGVGRDERREVDQAQQGRFEQLAYADGAFNAEKRLPREADRALLHRVDLHL
mmetsp:Transcript_13331/g.29954  ORF Transcript_13331/g.29954 Transcript_13331/m.29954 type:complete len:274 (+) Transcript_13331:568-1389(+)